ncbi:hypothetical protein WR25_11387 [Diploscapter pachys]|uniref:Sushi domain-containing protein n=1 Tax=Diploscapter pachys TaxID=2018661 RepID=A0A2A2L2Z1_9BILA|nr:hypothetical protein WR25_11387 [Diploscapter pachys]
MNTTRRPPSGTQSYNNSTSKSDSSSSLNSEFITKQIILSSTTKFVENQTPKTSPIVLPTSTLDSEVTTMKGRRTVAVASSEIDVKTSEISTKSTMKGSQPPTLKTSIGQTQKVPSGSQISSQTSVSNKPIATYKVPIQTTNSGSTSTTPPLTVHLPGETSCDTTQINLVNANSSTLQGNGTILIHKCNENYLFPDGEPIRMYECTSDGTWAGYNGDSCQPIRCPQLNVDVSNARTPKFLDTTLNGTQPQGTQIVHTCLPKCRDKDVGIMIWKS